MSHGIDHLGKASRRDVGREEVAVFSGLCQTGLLGGSLLEQTPRTRERPQAVEMDEVPYLVPLEHGHRVVVWFRGTLDGHFSELQILNLISTRFAIVYLFCP